MNKQAQRDKLLRFTAGKSKFGVYLIHAIVRFKTNFSNIPAPGCAVCVAPPTQAAIDQI